VFLHLVRRIIKRPTTLKKGERLWEVDFLRGIAVLMMLVSNFAFDLSLFTGIQTSNTFFWPTLARATAALFLLLVGVSLTLSLAKSAAAGVRFPKFFKRGITIFSLGLLVSLGTWYAFGDDLVVFGILHLIGFGIILAYPFLRHPVISFIVGIVVIAGGWFVRTKIVSFPWLIWLGIQYHGFSSVDFTPVFPWFGFILVGVFLGNFLFPGGGRRAVLAGDPALFPVRAIGKIGTRSLIIYFVHQPVFWGGFWVWQQIFK